VRKYFIVVHSIQAIAKENKDRKFRTFQGLKAKEYKIYLFD
jgi:hypothetical protein